MHAMRLPQAFEAAARLELPIVAHVPDLAYVCARVNMLRPSGELCSSAEDGRACVQSCGIRTGPDRVEWGRYALESADAVVCPCQFTIALHHANGFETESWHHVPWRVDYQLFPERLESPRGERLVVGFAGTLLRHKGAHVLVDAVASRPELPVELRLWGESFHEDDYERELRALAADDPRISFLGRYDHAGFRELLAELDVLVIPSLWHENLPTTGLNAVAAGVPLIVSDVGCLTELVADHACGLTFPVGDAETLGALLESLAREPDQLRIIRAEMSDPTSLEEEAWRVEGIYESVLDASMSASRRS